MSNSAEQPPTPPSNSSVSTAIVSSVEVQALGKSISSVLDQTRAPLGKPNNATVRRLLADARAAHAAAKTDDVVDFLAAKLDNHPGRFRNWGGFIVAVREDFGLWMRRRSEERGISGKRRDNSPEVDENDLVYLLDRLTELQAKAKPRWWAPDEKTVKRIILRAREKYPEADVRDIYTFVKEIIYEHSFDGWGGVVYAIRTSLLERNLERRRR